MSRTEIAVVVGTRPEAVKLAPVVLALQSAAWCRVRVVATAQHRQILDQILAYFGIRADVDLDLMRPDQSLADLSGRMIGQLDAALAALAPDVVLAQGDTTTVLVSALCCFYRDIAFGHVEAGLRTQLKRSPFPEEMNRRLVARLADLHFAPTAFAADNLRREAIDDAAIVTTGNTVIDALLWTADRVDAAKYLPGDGRRLLLVTAHRRESFGAPFEGICRALRSLADRGDVELLYPVHPNPNVRGVVESTLAGHPAIRLVEPLDYPDFVAAMKASHLILTDSGGVQEEGPSLGKPVLVMRDDTERPEGIDGGTSLLVGTDPRMIVSEASRLLDDPRSHAAMAQRRNPFGDGHASTRIVAALCERFAR